MTDNGLLQLRAELNDLQARKHDLELQIESDQSWLINQGLDPTQIPLQLIDHDGFPKVGVDHHGARIHASSMRSAINDHKKVMARLGEILNEYHELIRVQKETGNVTPISITSEHNRIDPEYPAAAVVEAGQYSIDNGIAEGPALIGFCRVNSVEHGSPAYDAGLRPADIILKFGTVILTMTGARRALDSIADLVRRSENRPFAVVIRRDSSPDPITLVLTPRNWSGRGLLGCHIIPLIEPEHTDL